MIRFPSNFCAVSHATGMWLYAQSRNGATLGGEDEHRERTRILDHVAGCPADFHRAFAHRIFLLEIVTEGRCCHHPEAAAVLLIRSGHHRLRGLHAYWRSFGHAFLVSHGPTRHTHDDLGTAPGTRNTNRLPSQKRSFQNNDQPSIELGRIRGRHGRSPPTRATSVHHESSMGSLLRGSAGVRGGLIPLLFQPAGSKSPRARNLPCDVGYLPFPHDGS